MKHDALSQEIRRVAAKQRIAPPHWSKLRKALNEAGMGNSLRTLLSETPSDTVRRISISRRDILTKFGTAALTFG